MSVLVTTVPSEQAQCHLACTEIQIVFAINKRRRRDPEEYRTDRHLIGTWAGLGSGWKFFGRICSLTAGAQMGYEGWEEQAAPNICGRQHHWRGRKHSDCLDVNEQVSKSGVSGWSGEVKSR